MAARIDAAGHRTEFTYDDDDRVVAVKRPGGGVERYEYDAEGARTAVILPGGKRHGLGRDVRGLLSGYAPAAGATRERTHTAHGRLTADGATAFAHEAAGGRATGATWDDAAVAYAYDGAFDRPASMTWTPSGGAAEGDAFTFDGAQTTGLTMTGTAQGAYTYGYDANGWLTSATLVSGAQTVNTALTRDTDGRLTADGVFTIVRGGRDGAPSAITGGGLNEALETDDLGRLKTRAPSVGADQRYRLELTYANDGKIARRVETVDGIAHTCDYHHDDDGQLTGVGNDPVALRDPTGLWCVGGSVYDGIGGGATICHTDEGWAVCFEVGFGIGIDGQVLSPGVDNGGPPPDAESIIAEAKANVPGFGVGISAELDNCGRVTPGASADLGCGTSTSTTARCRWSRP